MDFFDTDAIEGKTRVQVTETNLEQMANSRQLDHKMWAIEYLDTGAARTHFTVLLSLATYPIKSVSEPAWRAILRWMPAKEPDPESDKQSFELLVYKIMPWVNDLAAKQNIAPQNSAGDNQDVNVEEINTQICACLDYLFTSLPVDILNLVVLNGLRYSNFKVQVAFCQTIKHFYLCHPDKTLLELSDVFEALISNNSVGTKELKKHSLETMMAIYRVFGEVIDEFLDKLNSPEKVEAIKQGAARLVIREKKPPQKSMLTPAKNSKDSQLRASTDNKKILLSEVPALASTQAAMRKSKSASRIQPPPAPNQIVTSTLIQPPAPLPNMSPQHSSSRTRSSLISPMQATQSRPSQSPKEIPAGSIFNFDEYRQLQGSDLLLAFDDKWCKKLQIMKKEDAILQELSVVQEMVESEPKLLYFPEVNKTFLSMLKNYLMHSNPKIVSSAITIVCAIAKATTRSLQDGFPLFYPELIEKLKTKSKQDEQVIQGLIFLSSNVALPQFLRRLQKDFQEKNSTLRLNLIDVLCTVLDNKHNYDPSETARAGHVLNELKKFAEVELSKDLTIPVRKASERIVSVIQNKYAEEIAAIGGEVATSQLGDVKRSTTVGLSAAKKTASTSAAVLPDSSKKAIPAPEERLSVRASGGMMRSSSNIAPSIITESTAVPTANSKNSTIIKSGSGQTPTSQPQINVPQMTAKMQQFKSEKKDRFSVMGSANMYSSAAASSLNDTQSGFDFKRQSTLVEVTEEQTFEEAINLFEKSGFERRDHTHKAKLLATFEMLASKITRSKDADRLIANLVKCKDTIDPPNLVNILLEMYSTCNYFPPATLRTFLPTLLRISEMTLKSTASLVAKRTAVPAKLDSGDKRIVALLDNFIQYFGPVYFLEVFEETMYNKDLFQSKEAEPLFNLFESFLVKIPSELHPVNLVLSVVRGFIYLHNSQAVALGLGELVYILSSVYGKDNFKYIKKEFELANIREKVIDIARWPRITQFEEPEALQKTAAMKFKDKIISEVKDFSPYVKSLLSGSSQVADTTIIKELLYACTRHFIYTLGEKENHKLCEYLAEKFVDSNQIVQKMAVQIIALHFNSAKTSFKFSQLFYNNYFHLFKHNNHDIRRLALSSGFYMSKHDHKFYRLMCEALHDTNDDVKIDILATISKLMGVDKKFITSFELTANFDAIVALLVHKKTKMREEGEALVKTLLTHFERKDFNTLIAQQKAAMRKPLTDILAKIIEGKTKAGEGSTTEIADINPPGTPAEERNFVIKNMRYFHDDIAKCKSIREIKVFAQRHLDQQLFGKLFDVNIQSVLGGLKQLSEGLMTNANNAVKAFVFVFKLLNLLIEAETKQNEVSKAMSDILATLIKLRKNTTSRLTKQERWALCEFLLVLNKTKFEKKYLIAGTKMILGLMESAEEKSQFATLVERCDKKFYMTFMGGIPTVQAGPGTGDSVLKSGLGTVAFDGDYEISAPVLEELDGNDPNLVQFKANIGDQSEIEYRRGYTGSEHNFGAQMFGDEQQMHPVSPTEKVHKKHDVGKGLMSSGSSRGEDEIEKSSDRRASPSFHGRDLIDDDYNHLESPIFGSRIGVASNVTSPGNKNLGREIKGSFGIFPRIIGKPNEMFKNKQADIQVGRPLIERMTKNASTNDLNIKKASTGDQNLSDDNIFKMSPQAQSQTFEIRGLHNTLEPNRFSAVNPDLKCSLCLTQL